MQKIPMNNGWQFAPQFDEQMIQTGYTGPMQNVRLPRTVVETPFNYFDEKSYQMVSCYRKVFMTDAAWQNKRVLLTVEAAAHDSEVFINGVSVVRHKCGYTAFTADITDNLAPAGKDNVLAVKVDSRETADQPPFGFTIDYMTYGGLYRGVYLETANPVYISDVFVRTHGTGFESSVTVSGGGADGFTVRQTITPARSADNAAASAESARTAGTAAGGTETAAVAAGASSAAAAPLAECSCSVQSGRAETTAAVPGAELWTLEKPVLYYVTTELVDAAARVVDTRVVRFGFRDVRFTREGFFLNDKKIKLRGMNRHQSWPYVGYAMPANMQRHDADILKYELALNEVRTSHYPQSQAFIDRCDEIGLLVFTEIPGWQHIGGEEWQNQAVRNTEDMVLQYRNHPSIFMWGVRINESKDNDDLYRRTNEAAHRLDPTRPTGGVRCLKKSHLLEDVYTYNDFGYRDSNSPIQKRSKVTHSRKGYMITEYNGHMLPTKAFDCESHRIEHAMRHAAVINAVAADDDIAGASGWCAFDYNTHGDFGSGDRICYHGVMDMFRNPKLAAAVYRSQGDADTAGDVLEISSSMDVGEYPGCMRGRAWIYTNADSVKLYIDNYFIKEYRPSETPFTHIPHGPIPIDDFIGDRFETKEGISHSAAEKIKKLMTAVQIKGLNHLGAGDILRGAGLVIFSGIPVKQMRDLYTRYIGNWGGKLFTYRFEAYRGGKLVKTVVKSPSSSVHVVCRAESEVLAECGTYDVTAVHLTAEDESGNVLPFCNEAVSLSVIGPAELIGPEIVGLKGGMAATYLRTTGTAGTAVLTVTDWQHNIVSVPFTVTVQNC